MALNIGAALIAANALGIAAIASMWKDPNAVVAAVDEVKKGKWSMSGPETSTSATAKFVSLEERRVEEARVNVQELLKALENAQKDLKHKNAISAAVNKQLKDMQTLFPKATDQLASLTKQVSQTESDAVAAFLAVGSARTAYEQALDDLNALHPVVPSAAAGKPKTAVAPVDTTAVAPVDTTAGTGGTTVGTGGTTAGTGGTTAGTGGTTAGTGGTTAGTGGTTAIVDTSHLRPLPPGPGGLTMPTGTAGAGTGLVPSPDEAARIAAKNKSDKLVADVKTIHPNAGVIINGDEVEVHIGPVGSVKIWKVVQDAAGKIQFKNPDTNELVDRIPELDRNPPPPPARPSEPPEDPAAAAAAAAAAEAAAEEDARLRVEAEAEAAAAAEEDARLRVEAEAEANAGAEAARVAAEAQVAEEARLQAEAEAAEQARLQAEAEAAEQARLQAEAVASARFPTVGTPYLNQNGHPNTGFVVRYLQSPDQATSRVGLRTDFATWFGTEDDLLKPLKQNFKDWNDGTLTKYVDTSAGWSIKFMQAIDRASKVTPINEMEVERAIENVQEASTEVDTDVEEVGGNTSGSGGEGLSAPPSPAPAPPSPAPAPPSPATPAARQTRPRRGASGATGVQETPDRGRGLVGHFDGPTSGENSSVPSPASPPASPPSALEKLQTAIASSQAQRSSRARELVEEQEALLERERRQRINNSLAAVQPLGHPQNPTDSSRRETLGLPQLTPEPSALQRQKINVDLAHRGLPTRSNGGKRRGKGRKSTFRKKRKNKK